MSTIQELIAEGIGNVGVGKRGSKPCTPELVDQLAPLIDAGKIPPSALGAFLGALYMKGIEEVEQPLLNALADKPINNSRDLINALFPEEETSVREMAVKLLDKQNLTPEEAGELGCYLFSPEADKTAQGFFASVLRVKYETIDEYCGLLNAMNNSCLDLKSSFAQETKLVQLAEPFDGLNRSHLITPVIEAMLVQRGYTTISLGGRNAGPKYGNNTLSLARALDAEFIPSASAKEEPASFFISQEELSPAIDRWIEIRREIIKRPFVATLEKLVNPCNAQIGLFSAFHAPYADKMVDLALLNGFEAAVSVFKSMEGSLGLAAGRSCQMICGVKKASGEIIKQQFDVTPEELNCTSTEDLKLEEITIEQTAELIRNYLSTGDSGDSYFNARAAITEAAYSKVFDWIEANR